MQGSRVCRAPMVVCLVQRQAAAKHKCCAVATSKLRNTRPTTNNTTNNEVAKYYILELRFQVKV